MKKTLLSVALLLCTIIPAYSMERGKEEKGEKPLTLVHSRKAKKGVTSKDEEDGAPPRIPAPIGSSSSTISSWIPGESSAGILPFRRTSNGFMVLIIKGRDFGKDYKANRTYSNWSTLTGTSETTESLKETAIREGVEEMSFPLDKAPDMIEAYRNDGKLRASQESISYQKLKEALTNTKITPYSQAPGIAPNGKKFGSSFLYPVDVTEIASDLIEGHARNDKEFLPEQEELYNWCETAEMHWIDYKEIQRIAHCSYPKLFHKNFRAGTFRSVQQAIENICEARPSICKANEPQAIHGKREKKPTENPWRRGSNASGHPARR